MQERIENDKIYKDTSFKRVYPTLNNFCSLSFVMKYP